jgi:hypothetical protein
MRRCVRRLVEIKSRIQQGILRVKSSAAVARVSSAFESRWMAELFLCEEHQRRTTEQVKFFLGFVQLLGDVINTGTVAKAIFAVNGAHSNAGAIWAQRVNYPG